MSVLAFEGVGLSLGGSAVLDGIDLTLGQGEFVAVLGASGTGKTSLLSLAAGFRRPSTGQVRVDGRPVTGPGADRAVVFQSDALFPWLSVRDNVAFALRVRGVPQADRHAQADRLLDLVGLEGQGPRPISELSGGMRQRVGLARALAAEPAFLLMDEPLGALDAMTRERMQALILTVWRASGAGVLFITHGIEEALLLATRVVVLAGRPARVVADRPYAFAASVQGGASLREIKGDPAFVAERRRLTDALHDANFAALA